MQVLGFFPALIIYTFASSNQINPEIDLLSTQLASLFAVTISVYLARRFLDRRPFISLGLRINKLALRDVFMGVGIASMMMALIFFYEWAVGYLSFEGFAWQTYSFSDIILNIMQVLIIFIMVAWHEEIFSRGYQLQNLADGLNIPWGVLLSSLVFSALHWANPNANYASFFGLLLSGIFLAFGYLQTRQLWLPIGLHIGWNFFQGTVFGFRVSGLETFRLIQHNIQGPEWLTGGAFGPEAGIILLPS
ncbi:lysostaphin resistance A-like protein, partial [Chloroflexota bacterium]